MSMLERVAGYNQSNRARLDVPKLSIKPRPVSIGDNGQGHLLFSMQRDIVNQVLSPTLSQFCLDGASSLSFSRKAPPQRAQSAVSLASEPRRKLTWDRQELLSLSDSVRGSLSRDGTPGPDAGRLSGFLETALRDEDRPRGSPALDFETIEFARLDKLLAEILHFAEALKNGGGGGGGGSGGMPLQFRVDVSHAKGLRRAWRRRFRERYFMMDQHRCAVLVEGGRLKDVSFDSSLAYDLGKWHTKVTAPISELEGNLQFVPGHWWLNITCAERDGIVTSSLEAPTKGRYGIMTLPLLTGQEEAVRANTYKYIREGKAADMHVGLISHVGRRIRVLRGYRLKSILAPRAGIRYDGLFTVKQYGCKLDNKTNVYHLELTLERAPGQIRSLEDIENVPRPSQLDDWSLYEKLEGDQIRILQGEAKYLEWKLRRQEERLDREDWRRARLFRASVSQ